MTLNLQTSFREKDAWVECPGVNTERGLTERGRGTMLRLWPIGFYHSKILMVILEQKQQHHELVSEDSGQLRVFLLELAFPWNKIFCWPTSSSFLTSPFPSSSGPRRWSLREFDRGINYFLTHFGRQSFWSASLHAKAKTAYDKMFRSGCWVTELNACETGNLRLHSEDKKCEVATSISSCAK